MSLIARLLYQLGNRCAARGWPLTAHRLWLASLACTPYAALPWIDLGNAFLAEGDAHGALGAFRRALACVGDPLNRTIATMNASLALLTLGQWDDGWKLYEARFALPEFTKRNGLKGGDETKMWDGKPLNGKTLLIFNEQGVGDTLMCLRYVKLLPLKRCGKVILRVPASLIRLVRASNLTANVEVISDTERLPEYDFIVPFMSLPHKMRGYERIPYASGYLKPYASEQQYARASFPVVGLVWAGNPHHKGDKRRSIPFSEFAPLTKVAVHLRSFQVGPRADDAPVLARMPAPSDYHDTADMLRSLDLLITADTSIAHLAGALGISTWIMLPFAADFRWGQHSESTPFYSSVKLYRQTTPGDWSSVIERIRTDLSHLVQQRSAA